MHRRVIARVIFQLRNVVGIREKTDVKNNVRVCRNAVFETEGHAQHEQALPRAAAERLAERDRAAEKLVTNLLPVLDDMERAIDHAAGAASADGEDNEFDQFVAGVQAVHDKMLSILAKEGVEVIDPVGEAFDPMEHQAVGRVEDPDQPDETVAAVYQRGYRMGGRVIREAMVQVTFGGPKREVAKEDK